MCEDGLLERQLLGRRLGDVVGVLDGQGKVLDGFDAISRAKVAADQFQTFPHPVAQAGATVGERFEYGHLVP